MIASISYLRLTFFTVNLNEAPIKRNYHKIRNTIRVESSAFRSMISEKKGFH